MKPLVDNINKALYKIFSRHDKAFVEIMINWDKITGVQFANRTSPIKISNMTERGKKVSVLHVSAIDSSTSLELAYHQNIILERIAVYFGYKYIEKLRIKVM